MRPLPQNKNFLRWPMALAKKHPTRHLIALELSVKTEMVRPLSYIYSKTFFINILCRLFLTFFFGQKTHSRTPSRRSVPNLVDSFDQLGILARFVPSAIPGLKTSPQIVNPCKVFLARRNLPHKLKSLLRGHGGFSPQKF